MGFILFLLAYFKTLHCSNCIYAMNSAVSQQALAKLSSADVLTAFLSPPVCPSRCFLALAQAQYLCYICKTPLRAARLCIYLSLYFSSLLASYDDHDHDGTAGKDHPVSTTRFGIANRLRVAIFKYDNYLYKRNSQSLNMEGVSCACQIKGR